jgi:hypothetical protein
MNNFSFEKKFGAIMDQEVIPGSKIEKKISKFEKNDIFRGNFMRKIDCAHSRSAKTFV